jgi:hypothetical protein
VLFNQVIEEDASQAGGNGGDDDGPGKAAVRPHLPLEGILAPGDSQLADITPEVPDHGGERAHMNGHIERKSLVLPAEKFRGENQVRGTADGQELRKPLDDGQYDDVPQFHGRSS